MKTEKELIEEKKLSQEILKKHIKLLSKASNKNIENVYELSEINKTITHSISRISLINSVLQYEGEGE